MLPFLYCDIRYGNSGCQSYHFPFVDSRLWVDAKLFSKGGDGVHGTTSSEDEKPEITMNPSG
jgi:hypothetical protein